MLYFENSYRSKNKKTEIINDINNDILQGKLDILGFCYRKNEQIIHVKRESFEHCIAIKMCIF